MLLHYVLHRIAQKPCHGYEILQDIDTKTEGAWRPGAGSIYPILKRLLTSGYIKTDDKADGPDRRVYSITPKGRDVLKDDEKMFFNSGQKWMAMRRLFMELIEPRHLARFLSDGTRVQFELAQDVIKTKMKDIPPKELEFMLKDYTLNLERQLEWAGRMLKETEPPVNVKTKQAK
jgi:DNA-binding PadR family transcriptional regulator